MDRPPDWLDAPAAAVLRDLQGADPIPGLVVVADHTDDLNGLFLGLAQVSEPLLQLEDDLDPSEPVEYAGGSSLPRGLTGPALLVAIADRLQEHLAETEAGWGQSRPPCSRHPHPARAVVRDGEAWWICERDDTALYRVGRDEVPTRPGPPRSWTTPPRSRRAEKRRYGRERRA